MKINVVLAVVVGVALYFLMIYMRWIQQDLTGEQLLLIILTPLVVGTVSLGGAKKGAMLGFILSLIMLVLEAVIVMPGIDINIAFGVLLLSLPLIAISAALGAVGGLVGKRILKK